MVADHKGWGSQNGREKETFQIKIFFFAQDGGLYITFALRPPPQEPTGIPPLTMSPPGPYHPVHRTIPATKKFPHLGHKK